MKKLYAFICFIILLNPAAWAVDTLYVQHMDDSASAIKEFSSDATHLFTIENSMLKAVIDKGTDSYARFTWTLDTAVNITKNPYISFKAKSDQSFTFMIDAVDSLGNYIRFLGGPSFNVIGGGGLTTVNIDLKSELAKNPDFNAAKFKKLVVFTAAGKPFTGTVYFDAFKVGFDPNQVVPNVNLAPQINPIPSQKLAKSSTQFSVNLSGINDGNTSEVQTIAITASTNNAELIKNLAVEYTSDSPTGKVNFTPAPGKTGVATITLNISDNGPSLGDNINFREVSFNVFVTDSSFAVYKQNFDRITVPSEIVPTGTEVKLSAGDTVLVAAVDKTSFGGIAFSPANPIDLSALPNISFKVKADSTVAIYAVLYDINGKELNLSNQNRTVVGGASDFTKVEFDFKTMLTAEFDASHVKSITFFLNGGRPLKDTVLIDSLLIGFEKEEPIITGVETLNSSSNLFKVYPNPNNGLLNLKLANATMNNVTIYIVDNLGKNIKNLVISDFNSPIDLTDLDNGFYYIQTEINGQRSTIERFLISK